MISVKRIRIKIKEMCEKLKKRCKEHPLLLTVIIIIAVAVAIHTCLFWVAFPPQIPVVEPQKLDVSLSPGENFTGNFSIGVIGKGDIEVTLKATEPIDEWVYFSENTVNFSKKNITVEVNRTRTQYVNLRLNISLNTHPGEYKGAIEITHNRDKAEVPVFIKIQQAMVQIVEIEAPLKVNTSERFSITAKIKNIGNFDAFDATASVNLDNAPGLELAKWESKTEKIAIIPKNEMVSADWWFKATQTGWNTIRLNLESKNAGNDTEIIMVEVKQRNQHKERELGKNA